MVKLTIQKMAIIDFIIKLQNLPEQKKKAIIVIVVVVLAFVFGFFWLRSAGQRLSKLNEVTKEIKLPEIDIPKVDLPINSENLK